MENFEFFTPARTIFGKNTHQQVGRIVKEYGFKKVLAHFGGSSARKSGLLDAVTGSPEAEGMQYVTLGGIQVNLTLSKAKEGIELCLKGGVDLVLAVGGGSVISSSKCIADGAGNLDADIWIYSCQEAVSARALPVGVILALSVSDSEMSAPCVIINEENGFKRGFNSMTRRPLFSICNPELTCAVSKYQTAYGTVDIMMYTLEWCLSKTRDMEPADRIAKALLKPMVEVGRIADKDPDNYEARTALVWGGSFSHNGLTGAGREFFVQVHQLEHEPFGMCPSIVYGAGLATLWSSRARSVYSSDVNHFVCYAVQVWNIDMDFDCPMNTVLAGIRVTGDFYKSLGMPFFLKELGVEEECLEEMAVKCTNMGERTLLGIRELGKEEMMEIYKMALGEQRVQENRGPRRTVGMEIPTADG